MKRRNADCSKLRRPLKRNRITEGIYSSTFLYLKFLVVWVLVLLADFVLEFRFEYLWPFWLFIRSVYDSFRYQGLAFSVFFVCVAFTSDIICLLFIPVQWLFFAASTYVWVQYVWHTERGVCLPTVSLWILFVYMEAAIRFKDLKNFHVDLCRPFAAHCIGYPVVTLGFGFKSYVSYKMRLRKQKEVQKENEFYMQLLQQALPPEQQMLQRQEREAEEGEFYMQLLQQALPPEQHMLQRQEREAEEAAKAVSSDVDPTPPVSQNGSTPGKKTLVNASVPLPELEFREKGRDGNSKEREGKQQQQQQQQHTIGINNNSILHTLDSTLQETEYMENMRGKRLNNDLGGGEITHTGNTHTPKEEVGGTGGGKNCKNASGGAVATNSSPRNHSATNGTAPSSGLSNKNEKKTKSAGKGGANQKDPVENCIPNNQLGKPDALVRLEQDVKRLKADLQASRQLESDLRSHLSSLTSQDRSLRSELGQLRQDNEMLQNNADQAKQKDKQTISQLEKRLKAEQEARALAEKQLADERKRKKVEEATAARAVALAVASRGECTDSLRGRIRELETECKKLNIDVKLEEEHIRELEGKCQELRKYKENEKDMEVLMSALSAMQDKTQHLENSLSAETRIKLDLFSALGDAKRQLEIAQGQIHQRDQEIAELKQKIAEVMAVMPSISYSNDSSSLSPVTPHYSSKFMDNSPSSLDPNASVYQPLKK
ncbi:macoilin-1 isoform X28 [Oncorhynchus keta]|uniref:macoilin-1 isoform X28 n=1 Tax=Oncorhynchus keta TaxID=8018 RepID=UPI00227D6447|nr:macoilin-1 isoform X28 [Oncorhynchus keta]